MKSLNSEKKLDAITHEPSLELTMRLMSTVFVNDSKSIKTADSMQIYPIPKMDLVKERPCILWSTKRC